MGVVNEPKLEFTKSHKLKKASFRQFLAFRYGSVVAEKWQNLMQFDNPIDFETYCSKIVTEILQKQNVMYQLAFDFFDCNNDEKISEFDIFKILHFYGIKDEKSSLFTNFIQKDILTMLKLFTVQKLALK